MVCERCNLDKPEVQVVIDPYYQELYDENYETALCMDCYKKACEDI